ncbi:MAG: glycosyltransferase family 2 protein [Halolamina sp.]
MSLLRPVESAAPELSVVVGSTPEYDHAGVVDALRRQTASFPYEVLIVNDGDLDRSAARNVGLDAADADVVALTDDDCRPPPEWLRRIKEAFDRNPDLACLEGAVHGGAHYGGRRHYVGCNLAVDPEAALSVGGFDSDFAGWREDTEFGWRMERDATGNCRFDPQVRMCHPTVPRSPLDRRRERMLRRAYPERYATILDDTLGKRLYRTARAAGVTAAALSVMNRGRRFAGRVVPGVWDC